MASILDANVTGLKAELANWIHRSDLTSTDLGGFIWMFEAKFNTEMRTRGMAATGALTISNGIITHPQSWREWKSLTLVIGTDRYPLNPLSQESADLVLGGSYGDLPRGYVVKGDSTYIYPGPGAGSYSIEGWWYTALPTLGQNSITTNWLLTSYPHMYLYGSLLEANAFVGDDPRIGLWKTAVDEGLDRIERETKNANYSGAVMQSRPDRVC